MALQFILGEAGSGKSRNLHQQIIRRSMAEPEGRFLVIVPEQFTMQTQRDLVLAHERQGISNIDVLSFLRLAYRVFEEIGMPEKLVLEDTGKNMVLRRLLTSLEQELSYFKNTGRKQGFVEELKSLLTELYQYSVTPEKLEQVLAGLEKKPLLQRKLSDTLLVYQAFQQYKERDGYIVAEEMMDLLCEVLPQSAWVRDSVVCLDGFTGFTPSQNKLLRLLLTHAKDVVVTVSIDPAEPLDREDEEFRLFHLSKKTISKLMQMAEEEGVPVATHYYTDYQHGHPQIHHLKKQLFRYPVVPYQGMEEGGISLHVCKNPRAEAEFVLTEIARLVREEGYRYRDIAVITGDMATYSELLEEVFDRGEIFRFLDSKRDITRSPLVEFLRASLAVIEQDFDYESVMRYLRSGLSDVAPEQADIFENELLARGIRGKKRYQQCWYEQSEKPGGAAEENPDVLRESTRRQVVEEVRAAIWQVFCPLVEAFAGEEIGTGASLTQALYEFLVAHQAEQKLTEMRQDFARRGELLLEKEYVQVYRLVMGLFEKLYALLGEEELTAEECRLILESGFAEEQVGVIPPGLDQVLVGDLERTRLKDIKALFCLGVNEGIVPKVASTGGILTDMDREVLGGLELELAPTVKSRNYTEQFYLYLNLTKPEEHLYLTWSGVGLDGKQLRPSYLVGKVRQLFPELVVQNWQPGDDMLAELRRDRGLEYLLRGLEANPEERPPEWQALLEYYGKEGREDVDFIHLQAGYQSKAVQNKLQQSVAEALYGEVNGSVTRLEQYAGCAFAHFLDYGLRLAERKEYTVSIPDLGSIFHDAIARFSRKLQRQGVRWGQVEEEQRKELVHACVEEATAEYGDRVLHSSRRLEALIDRVERMTDRTVWAICEQVKMGEFEPTEFETRFSIGAMQGQIDRIDKAEQQIIWEDGTVRDVELIRVIDYKSGGTDFDLNRFYHGLNLQLVVYLGAALGKERAEHPGKLVIPAGIFYYQIQDPLVKKGEGQEAILKELALKGRVHDNVAIEGMMDRNLVDEQGHAVPSAKSLVIPVSFTKEGVHAAVSRLASENQMNLLVSHGQKQIASAIGEILEGNIAASPYQMEGRSGCDYCAYQSVCGFDRRVPGYQNRKWKKQDETDIWIQMTKEVETDG